jgi:hypothetical protein
MTAASDYPELTTARTGDPGGPGGTVVATREAALLPGPDDDVESDVDSDLGSDLGEDDTDEADSDWAWVQEWRQSDEPPAWSPGVAIAVFAMLVVASAVFVLSVGLGDMPWLAVAANVVVAAGLAPALWLCRSLPVLRFLAGGAAVGIVIGWIAALMN